jgi:hypothetical protein
MQARQENVAKVTVRFIRRGEHTQWTESGRSLENNGSISLWIQNIYIFIEEFSAPGQSALSMQPVGLGLCLANLRDYLCEIASSKSI